MRNDKEKMDIIDTKKCAGECGLKKTLDLFAKDRNRCKVCVSTQKKRYYQDNKKEISIIQKEKRNSKSKEDRKNTAEYQKEYRKNNKDRIRKNNKKYYEEHKEDYIKYNEEHQKEKLEYNKRYYQDHKEELLTNNKEYYQKHQESRIEYSKKYRNKDKYKKEHAEYMFLYRKDNKEKILAQQIKYQKNRISDDPSFRFRIYLSKSICKILKSQGSSKDGCSILEYLPYTFDKLVNYIFSLFEPWMTWQNQGVYRPSKWDDFDPSTWKWQLDHIIPQSDLPYTSMEDENFKKCWALENLRPLSAKQNHTDGVNRARHTKKNN